MKKITLNDCNNIDFSVSSVNLALSKKCPINWKLKKVSRELYGLIFILNGSAEYVFEDRTECAQKNDVVFFKLGDTYQTTAVGSTNLEFIVISFSSDAKEVLDHLPFKTVNKISHALRFEELFRYIEEIWFAKSICYKVKSKSMVQNLICELLEDVLCGQVHIDNALCRIKSAVDFIENHLNKKIEIGTLAEISGYSVSYFRKKFTEVYGESPVKYLINLRIEKAKDMLKSDMYSLKEIAEACGFENVCYFSRVFKKETGNTPKKY